MASNEDTRRRGSEEAVDYTEMLRRLAIDDEAPANELEDSARSELDVDPKTLALARIGALIALGAAEPSFGSQIDAAISAGASAKEIVHILVGVTSVVGVPRVVEAAPKVAMALGHDLYDEDTGRIAGASRT
jgi:4-carboxymuconolactone decarboxylase